MSRDLVNQQIAKAIRMGDPFLVSRFGRSELLVTLEQVMELDWSRFRRWVWKIIHGEFSPSHQADRDHLWISGFYPYRENQAVREFAEIQIVAGREIDIIGSWVPGENLILPANPKLIIASLPDIEPFLSRNPWTSALEGKSVLLVHPFAESIRRQYKRRRKIHQNSDLLPSFRLLTIRPPVTRLAPGNIPSPGEPTWFERLDNLKDAITNTDFDVAIIGAGSYGMPIAAHAKKLGKVSINLGGASQLLFGIWGSRWDSYEPYARMRNDFWVRPIPEETPQNADKVEDRAYW